jgi:Cof subfamily protein (haloacid dehalogenase superfamily)
VAERRFRLIATDLDGTLLRGDGTVSARTLAALAAARAAGLIDVLVSGRPPRTLRPVAERVGATGLAVCCNGAIVYDLAGAAIVHHATMPAEVAQALVAALLRAAPGVCFAVERGLEFGCEPAWLAHRPLRRDPVPWQAAALALCAEPLTKLIALHPALSVEELHQITTAHADGQVTVTYSGAGFLEIAAAGVDKASALRWLCDRHGIAPAEVIAFGDMPNDLAMLRWAGRAVAVANAHPAVLAAAHEVTRASDEDGVAVVLERLLAPSSAGDAPDRRRAG